MVLNPCTYCETFSQYNSACVTVNLLTVMLPQHMLEKFHYGLPPLLTIYWQMPHSHCVYLPVTMISLSFVPMTGLSLYMAQARLQACQSEMAIMTVCQSGFNATSG